MYNNMPQASQNQMMPQGLQPSAYDQSQSHVQQPDFDQMNKRDQKSFEKVDTTRFTQQDLK
jgi:hypothetical protein